MPGVILAQAIGRWGNFMNQEAHGGPVSKEFISKFPEFIQTGCILMEFIIIQHFYMNQYGIY